MNEWVGMPEFVQEKQEPFKKIKVEFIDGSYLFVRFENESDHGKYKYMCHKFNFCNVTATRSLFSKVSKQKITDKTKSIWFPFKSHWGGVKHKYIGGEDVKNRYPIYIVSKGRFSNGLTWKALDRMGLNYYIICEIHEASEYKEKTNGEILVLPSLYLNTYDTCDDLGNTKSKGPGAARNFAMDHSRENGFKRHWVLDDNIDAFHYLNKNEKLEVECGATFAAAEDFVDRYSNVPVAGMNYYSFAKKTDKVPPLKFNTRIYSCLLIDNYAGYSWRGRYNEDTDLSLRVLKDGLCTVQFNAFLCGKVTTQRMRGGNSKEFYDEEGTKAKSQMLEDLHPDVAKVVWKFNRWHHNVNYKAFEENEPKLINPYRGISVNNYGMIKVKKPT